MLKKINKKMGFQTILPGISASRSESITLTFSTNNPSVDLGPVGMVIAFASNFIATPPTEGTAPYSYQVKRDGADDSTYASDITFTCDDVGSVNLVIRATDSVGNTGIAPSTVTVTDSLLIC